MAKIFYLFLVLLYIAFFFTSFRVMGAGIFEVGKSHNVQLRLVQYQKGKFIPVESNKIFHTGDQIKFQINLDAPGYIYIVNVTPYGKAHILFPKIGNNNQISSQQFYEFPSGNSSFIFDDEPGIETIRVYATKNRILEFDSAIQNTNGVLSSIFPPLTTATADLNGNSKFDFSALYKESKPINTSSQTHILQTSQEIKILEVNIRHK